MNEKCMYECKMVKYEQVLYVCITDIAPAVVPNPLGFQLRKTDAPLVEESPQGSAGLEATQNNFNFLAMA